MLSHSTIPPFHYSTIPLFYFSGSLSPFPHSLSSVTISSPPLCLGGFALAPIDCLLLYSFVLQLFLSFSCVVIDIPTFLKKQSCTPIPRPVVHL